MSCPLERYIAQAQSSVQLGSNAPENDHYFREQRQAFSMLRFLLDELSLVHMRCTETDSPFQPPL